LREDIRYQSHPAFVKENRSLSEEELEGVSSIGDFKLTSSRGLRAEDYEYAIKRMGVRKYHSPILDTMQEYIVGLREFSQKIVKVAKDGASLDLRG
jgi:hypothetical protein